MVYLSTDPLYFNLRRYFVRHYHDYPPTNWYKLKLEFQSWIESQGAIIVHSEKGVIRNSLGLAPGFDLFGFEREEDAIIFALKWS